MNEINQEKTWDFYDRIFAGCEPCTVPSKDADAPGGQIIVENTEGKLSAERVRVFCSGQGISAEAFFTAAFGLALKSYTAAEEAVFIAARQGRTLPVLIRGEAGQTVSDLLSGCGDYLRAAAEQDGVRFTEISERYGIRADVIFAWRGDQNKMDTQTLEESDLCRSGASFAVKINLEGDAVHYCCAYNPSLYTAYTMHGFMTMLDQIVCGLLEKQTVGEIALVSSEDEEKIRSLYDTDWPVAERPAYRLLQDTAARLPDKTALVAIDRTLSFRELNEEANAVGHALQKLGAGPETIVAVLAERNSWAYVMRQGILKSGGAFLPIDPEYPEDRIRFILNNSGAKLAVTTHSVWNKRRDFFSALAGEGIRILFAEDAAASESRENLNVEVSSEALAYVIYTSGSTGTPKGVMLTNRNLVNYVDDNPKNAEARTFVQHSSVTVSLAAFTFDASISEEFITLAHGLTNVLATQEQFMDATVMRDLMLKNGVDGIDGTPSYYLNMLEIEAFHPAVRQLKLLDAGAEAFPVALYEKLVAINPELLIINSYGPTECTVTSSMKKVTGTEGITVGEPLANYHMATIDRDGRLQPLGALGEMVIMGDGVGRGYVGRDDLNKKNFIQMLGMRAYRSGDLARILENGEIEFHGRIDNQVKLRGLRVELGEIENVLNSFPGVRSSIVLVIHGETDYLGAWFTADHEISIEDLKAHLASRLTAYMVPQAFLQLEQMPLTANGKIDKKALPELSFTEEELTDPENELQAQLLDMAKEIIGTERIGVDTDLFSAGLSSLGCIRLSAMTEEKLGLTVRVAELYDCRTVRELAALLDGQEAQENYELREEYPLSMTQMGIYVESERFAGTTVYNVPALYLLDPQVEPNKLREALTQTVLAHPVLSMGLRKTENGEVLAVRRQPETVEIPVVHALPDREGLVQPFDLTADRPLYRLQIFDTPAEKYLFVDFHHIVMDGGSLDLFVRDVNRAYLGNAPEAERYSGYEYALDEGKSRASDRFEKARDFYDGVFAGCEPCTLPVKDADAPGGRIAVGRREGAFPAERVRDFCRKHRVSINTFFTTAFGLALKAYTASEEAVFASIYNGRNDSRLTDSVGMYVKTLPVLIRGESGQKTDDLLSGCQNYLLGAMSHDIFSFAEISNRYGIRADALFAYQGDSLESGPLEIGGCPAREQEALTLSQAMALLSVETYLVENTILYAYDYDPALYTAYTVDGFVGMMDQIVCGLLEKQTVGEIALVSSEDEEKIRSLYDTDWPVAERPAYRLLQDTAARLPDKTALVAIDRTLSFRELNEEANAMGHALQKLGAGPETIVAVLAERDSWAYVMRQGALKSGGAFLPIDPEYPEDRIRFILNDSGAKLAVTTHSVWDKRRDFLGALAGEGIRILFAEDAAASESRENLNVEVASEALAYVIYTSGSTGTPKGVMLTNRNVVNYADDNPKNAEARTFVQHSSVTVSLAAFTFDVSVAEEFITLAHGLTNVLATQEQFMDATVMRDLMLKNGVDGIDGTPSYYLNMLEIEAFHSAVRQLKLLDAGAEAFPAALYEKLVAINPELLIINSYGPTECTITSSMKKVTGPEGITIGKPIANFHMATIDRDGRLQSLGALGEMVIMGDGVGRGYIGRDDLNKKNFIQMLGMRAYRSGDLVRILEDGEIEFHGRIDNQVKLRGLRVELGEIENVLNSFPGVRSSIVLVIHGETDYLGAWFTADHEISIEDLKAHLASRLTAYMVPQAFLQLEQMPLTANGKIDKKALPELSFTEEELTAPETELQAQLLDMAKEIIGTERIGVDTDLFSAGLSSLGCIRLSAVAEDRLGVALRVAELFEARTVRQLAERVTGKEGQEVYSLREEYPLSMTQTGIYVESERFAGTTVYNIPYLYRLDARTDTEKLCKALIQTVLAHPVLSMRLRKAESGEVLAVRRQPETVEIPVVHVLPDREGLVQPFDLTADRPLYRLQIFDTPAEKYLFLDFHHIVMDGESLDLFLRDVNRAYLGDAIEAEHYSGYEYALDEEKARASDRFEKARDFYDGIFTGCEPCTLPVKDADAPGGRIAAGRREGASPAERIRDFCRKHRVSVNTFFTTAFGLALKAYTASEEAVFASIYNGRNDSRLTDSVGMYVKTLPVLIRGEAGQKTDDLLSDCQSYLLGAMGNDIFSFAEISNRYGIRADALFAYQGDSLESDSLQIGGYAVEEPDDLALSQAKAAIDMNVSLNRETVCYEYEYDPALYNTSTMDGFVSVMDQIVCGLLEKQTVGEIALVTAEDEERIRSLHDTDWPVAERPAYRLMQDVAERLSEKTALVAVDRSLSYRELNEEANAVGHALQSLGAGPETIVAVLAERNSWAYVMRQGILKSGGAFLPIDPEYPDERIRFILENSGAKLAVTTKAILEKKQALLEDCGVKTVVAEEAVTVQSRENLNVEVAAEALAYVIYTSGSTGTPKGVMLTNRNLVNFVDANAKNREVLGYTERGHVSLAIAALTFDYAIMEEFVPIANGMTAVLATNEQILNPQQISRLMVDNHVDVMSGTPGYVSNLLSIDCFIPAVKGLRSIDFGAEAFPPALFHKLKAVNPELYIMNGYGPTEATISCTMDVVESAEDITIGIPNANVHVATIDRDGRLQPLGALGEMVILGEGVGRGYIGRDDLTRKSFIWMLGMRAYRSGDLVRILKNGKIEFHGRIDNQVKLRGLRVELGEIESVLNAFPGVRSSIVLVIHGETDYLGAWFTADREISVEELKAHLASRLTAYMVPQAFLQLEQMPLTANGKIDKKALPELSFTEEALTAPENGLQAQILDMAKEIIGTERIGVDTDLFAAGLSSLGCIRLSAVAEDRLSVSIRVAELFEARTVRKLAELVSGKEAEEVYALQEDYPLSMTQMGIFVESIHYAGTTVYNIPYLYRLDTRTDTEKLRKALAQAVLAHPVLSMTLRQNESGDVRAFRSQPEMVEVPVVHALPDREGLVQPFDLTAGTPLYRVQVFDTPAEKYLFLDFHHIVMDGESLDLFLRDVNRAYLGDAIETEHYSGYEYALDEENARASDRFEKARQFYDGVFRGCEPCTLPAKEENTEGGQIAEGRRKGSIGAPQIRTFCDQRHVSPNALFTAAFGLALKAYTASEEAVFTTIYNGRNDPRLSDSVGMYVKTLPVLIRGEAAQSTDDLLSGCQSYLLGAMGNDIFSFAEISETYGIRADAIFAFQGDSLESGPLQIGGYAVEEPDDLALSQAKASIDMNVSLEGDAVCYEYEYDPSLYSPYTMDGFVSAMDQIVCGLLEKQTVGEIALVTAEDEERIRSLHDTDWPVAERPAYRLMQDVAERQPEKTALIAVDRSLSYRELNEEANAVGHALQSLGAGPETIVAVLAERNSWAYVMRQGILKSGGAFLPIDPEYPDERIRFILENSGAKLAVTTKVILEQKQALLEDCGVKTVVAEEAVTVQSRENLNVEVAAEALAYVIYTSGSTGTPKGVMLTNRNLVNFVDANAKNREVLGYTERGHVSLAIAALTFDYAIMEEFVPIANGMTAVLATNEQILNPQQISRLMVDNHVDVMSGTPGYVSNLLSIDCFIPAVKGLRSIDFGAEAFPPALFHKLKAVNPELYIMNGYGPTEATISCTMDVVESAEDITIGIPNANVHVATIDRDGRLQPLGVLGEMVILGEGVGRGYIGRDDLTRKSFIRMLGMRAYRSGDLVRILKNGKIEFHGRIDNQVKLRGLRVELGEIESVLNAFPGVRSSIVLVIHGETDYLGAWFTADREISVEELKTHLASRLTAYMVPQAFLQLEQMPLTANGKIDKKALPPLQETRQERSLKRPETEMQKTLCELFSKALGVDEIGVDDDFFAMGGTSLSAAKVLMGAISQDLSIEYQDIFDARTVEKLEQRICGRKSTPVEHYSDAVARAGGSRQDEEIIRNVLAQNVSEHVNEIRQEGIGDVLLTGSTGFLGIHVLRELLEHGTGKVICLVRSKHRRTADVSAESRLRLMLFYYFDRDYKELVGSRLFVREGSITNEESLRAVEDEHFDTVINCAASVKHFGDYDELRRNNVDGVKNLVELCLRKKARLIQTSTVSVAGEALEGEVTGDVLRENALNIGQETESNAYVHTKYLAEECVLRAVAERGLDAKIMRLSNLMSRQEDGEFQMNFRTNNFMNTLRAYTALGCCPYSAMDEQTDFSPIDETAHGIVTLAGTPAAFTVFHVYNSHMVDMGDVFSAMEKCGIHLDTVDDEIFEAKVREGLANPDMNMALSPLVNYRMEDEAIRQEIPSDNRFSIQALYRLGFRWNITDDTYLEKVIRMLQTLAFFGG